MQKRGKKDEAMKRKKRGKKEGVGENRKKGGEKGKKFGKRRKKVTRNLGKWTLWGGGKQFSQKKKEKGKRKRRTVKK